MKEVRTTKAPLPVKLVEWVDYRKTCSLIHYETKSRVFLANKRFTIWHHPQGEIIVSRGDCWGLIPGFPKGYKLPSFPKYLQEQCTHCTIVVY